MIFIRQLSLAFAAIVLAGCGAGTSQVSDTDASKNAAARAKCDALKERTIGFGTVGSVDYVEKGDELIEMSKRLLVRAVFSYELPPVLAPRSFCRVNASLVPVPGSLIKVQVWLPTDWNGKMLAKGGGGFNGGLFSASISMRDGSAKGYATVVTDVGHDMSESAKFAYDSKEAFIDYGYRGNHSTAVFTKQLIQDYYGKSPRFAYFEGGSNGGREALMEARRFPDDYDGIIAGMPAMSFTRLMTAFLWNAQAVADAPGLKDKLGIVRKAVLDKCDAIDGVADGALAYPPACEFDPAQLKCAGDGRADCLTEGEVFALRRIHEGPRLSDGTQVLPGLAVGSEVHPTEMDFWILGDKALQPNMAQEAFRWMVHRDPKWDRSRFKVDVDFPATAAASAILDADDPDLAAFLGRGGKLIMHHGWNDNAIPPAGTVNYYEALLNKAGVAAENQVRLFMVPGMGHGTGRPGPEYYDVFSELERWVEGGAAPDQIVAYQYAQAPPPLIGPDPGTKPSRSILLCAWPKVAEYKGAGSTDDHSNFRCQ